MKKILTGFLIGIFAGALILYFVNQKWPIDNLLNKKKNTDIIVTSSAGSGFSSITSKLEKGGDLFAYLNTAKITNTIEKSLNTIKDTINTSENISEVKKKENEKWFSFMSRLLNDSGLLEISGIGISSKEYEKGITRSRFIVQHEPGKGEGLIWNITGKSEGDLGSLDMLPDNTVFSSFSNFNYFKLWSWIKDQAERSGDDKIRFGITSMEKDLKNMGVDLSKLLRSINGDSGIIITLDEANKKKFLIAGKDIEFPDPSIALVFETKNDSIFKLLSSRIPEAKVEEIDGRNTVLIKVPDMPFTFFPRIIQSNNMLVIASNSVIAEKVFGGNADTGLKSTEEFKILSKGMPDSGNSFTFMSSSLVKEIMRIQQKLNTGGSEAQKKEMDILKKLGLSFDNLSMMRITSKTDEGYTITTNTTIKTELLMMLPVVTAGGVIAAIMIPRAMKNKMRKVNPKGQSQNLPSREL